MFFVSALRTIVEVAMLALLGQGLLAILAGAKRQVNPVYRFFQLLTSPVLKIIRFTVPRVILDRHLPFVAIFMLFWLWIALAYIKRLI